MATANFSLQTKDYKRLVKDRLVRWIVSFGGVSVLASLIGIFIYFALVIFPLFENAEVKWQPSVPVTVAQPVAYSTYDPRSRIAVLITDAGEVIQKSLVTQAEQRFYIADNVDKVQKLDSHQLLVVQGGQLSVVKVDFVWQQDTEQYQLRLEPQGSVSWAFDVQDDKFSAAVSNRVLSATVIDHEGRLHLKQINLDEDNQPSSKVTDYRFNLELPSDEVSQLLVTPDGKQIFVATNNQLYVLVKSERSLFLREIVDLSLKEVVGLKQVSDANVLEVNLLSGAHSLLVTYDNQQVWQWFDTVTNQQRRLTPIRPFNFESPVRQVLPADMSKSFFALLENQRLEYVYTTSEKRIFSEDINTAQPAALGVSSGNNALVVVENGQLNVLDIDNPHPEISLSSLWEKVWYESYPEPDFVWQTASASDDFEAKYSLVPITFGTIKAALFAMLFAVPVAVFGAIYTAYFMSANMRKVVKPTIELMEALPTVIIGFLAGIWFAPLVESHLPAIVALLVALPVVSLAVGVVWYVIPDRYSAKFPSGFHPFILIPVIVLTMAVAISFSPEMEALFFAGDARAFLAERGIDFDQRNALVVGFAMGFAVIPTIFTIAEDAIFSVPKHLSDGSLALGATQWQTLTHVVLLTASPGIFSAVMMGLGRAVGETMIVLMATGNTPILDWNVFEGMRTLSATMAVELPESEVNSTHYRLLFLVALILFSFTFVVNSLAEWVRQRLREKYSAL
ncbi:ABC transporter permease subunit [Vibrio hippocampi]|uniref:ABC transmembrane type-1 domain-containing protein n=1 Tax=Vibrio hippocampi TaxID=654686 RepID=A0ABM8ZEM9_9VIBR|nr:ABC transporter permease subunit [Vibrio hippocampi]CAH0524846.1 hypothetical protein VHP8226_00521 [Vibrio hippocampi]